MPSESVMPLPKPVNEPSVDYRQVAARAFAVAAKTYLHGTLPRAEDVSVRQLLYGSRFNCSVHIGGIDISGIVNDMNGNRASVRIIQVTGHGFPSSFHRYEDVSLAYLNMLRGISG